MKYPQNKCVFCGVGGKLTRDHIIPKALGGLDCSDNIQKLCSRCNQLKKDMIQRPGRFSIIKMLNVMTKRIESLHTNRDKNKITVRKKLSDNVRCVRKSNKKLHRRIQMLEEQHDKLVESIIESFT